VTSAKHAHHRNSSIVTAEGSPLRARSPRITPSFGPSHIERSHPNERGESCPVAVAGKTTLSRSSPLAQQQSRHRYTHDWLRSNLIDCKESEKSSWWSDESTNSNSSKASEEALDPDFTNCWLGNGSEPGRIGVMSSDNHAECSLDSLAPQTTMLAATSTNPRLPSPDPRYDRKHAEIGKPLPPRPTQLDRTVSEAPVLDSSPNAQHSLPKIPRPSISGLQSFQRPKKRVLWHGKACIIALPLDGGRTDSAEKVYVKPEDVRRRLEGWESQGYDTRGFRLSSEISSDTQTSEGQSRRIYPDQQEIYQERRNRLYRVSIPDRRAWEAHVSRLNEEKLRALGVSFGDDQPSAGTTTTLETRSRYVSSTDPVAMLSPSIASSSPVSYNDHLIQQPRGPMMPKSGDCSRASQDNPHETKPSVAHFPRYSIMTPIGGFPPTHSITRPTPPPSRTWSPSQQYNSQPATRGASPIVTGPFQNPTSGVPTNSGMKGISAASEDSRQLLALMQQEQARLQAQQLHQQQQQQLMMVHTSQPGAELYRINDESLPTRYNTEPEIASPIPRGHRQNLSKTLQKEIEEAESSLDAYREGPSGGGKTESGKHIHGKKSNGERPDHTEKDDFIPKSQRDEIETHPSPANTSNLDRDPLAETRSRHVSKSSMTKLDATAPAFEYQPRKPSCPDVFAFQGDQLDSPTLTATGPACNLQLSNPISCGDHSGLNVAAPAFVPANFQKRNVPSREFSFSSSGPVFKPDTLVFNPMDSGSEAKGPPLSPQGTDSNARKIFGNIEFSEVIKPAKKSKAIPIIKPSESQTASEEDADGQEDESGRITQPEGRQKRIRRHDNDGDQVPLFANPGSPIRENLGEDPSRLMSPLSAETSGKDDVTPLECTKGNAWVPFPLGNAQEAAMFNVALPLESPLEKAGQNLTADSVDVTMGAIRDFPNDLEIEISAISGSGKVEDQDDISESISSTPSSESIGVSAIRPSQAHQEQDIPNVRDFVADSLIDGVTYIDESFKEIDAVMKHLNAEDSDLGVVRHESPCQARNSEQDPLVLTHESLGSHQPLHGSHLRSDAPSPSPNRLREPYQYLPPTESESADTADRDLVARNARFSPSYRPSKSDIRRLNSPGSRSISDWDDAICSSDEQKFHTRSSFLDERIHGVVGGIVRRQLGTLQENLAVIIKENIAAIAGRSSSRKPRRTLSEEAEQSDADDEDDEGVTSQPRLRSPKRDQSYESLKASIQDIAAAQQQLAQPNQLIELVNAVNELRTNSQQAPKSSSDIKTIVEEAVGRQLRGRSGPITSSHQSATAEKSQLHIDGLESMLKIAETRAEDELKARRATEDALADNQRLLRSAMHEAAEQRESAEETERSLAIFHEERHETLRRTAMLEGLQESLDKTVTELSEKNAALEDTLKEYRLSSAQWRQEIEDSKAENIGLTRTIDALKTEIEERVQGRETLRGRFERLQEDMTTASDDIARDQFMWRNREEEYNAKLDLLAARLEAEARTRERLEVEIDRLEVQEKEAMRAQFLVDQTQKANVELERVVGQLKTEKLEHQQTAYRLERELHDARETTRTDTERTKTAMGADLDAAKSQINAVRDNLESVISRLQSQLDNAITDAADVRSRHELMLEEASESRQLALRQAAEARDAALQEHYRFQERTIGELRSQHERALSNLTEDKSRSVNHLNERLALADEKVTHYTDRVAHLEEKLEIAKSAAHAAVQAAQSQMTASTSPSSHASLPFARGTNIPEKISPQALRESIIVLQEQLQAREGRIEKLEQELSEVDNDAPEKMKKQEMEINWLRELLGVRIDDLQDIISDLSQPSYNREAVKDAAIRLKANLQMEQQEKEPALARAQTFPSLASISNLAASPQALPLAAAAAWSNWRRARETPFSSLSSIASESTNQTPSRSATSAQGFLSSLMTPPGPNARQIPPTQQNTKSSRPASYRRPLRPCSTPRQSFMLQEEDRPSKLLGPPATPPLMRQTSYDQDAQTAEFPEDDASGVRQEVGYEDEPFGPNIHAIGDTS